jgi:hypothetical protein
MKSGERERERERREYMIHQDTTVRTTKGKNDLDAGPDPTRVWVRFFPHIGRATNRDGTENTT